MLRVKILGDHSKYHCGSWAVIDYLRSLIGAQHLIVEGDADYDVLVMNGEGSMHNSSSTFLKKMELLRDAQRLAKRTVLVNSVWENNSLEFDDVLGRVERIILREPASQADLRSRHGLDATVRLDCSYFAEVRPTAHALNLSGRECVTDFFSREALGWVRFTEGAYAGHQYLDMRAFSWGDYVETLKTSSLLITGRHHAVFAACRAKTPFVAIESNTHKISGMVRMAELPIPVCGSARDLPRAVKWARANRAVYEEFFSFLDSQPKLTLEDLGLSLQ